MITTAANIAIIIILTAIAVAFIRIIIGPGLPNRVVALDLISYLMLGLIIVFAIKNNQKMYLDIVMVASMVIFLITVSISLYLKKRRYDK